MMIGWQVAIAQLVKKSSNDPNFDSSNLGTNHTH
jgi:hypothetical protein